MRRFPLLFLFCSLLFGAEYTTAPALSAAESPKSVLWVFAVGVSQYRNSTISLQYADNDAETLASALKARSGKIFRAVNTRVLVNQQADRQAILSEMHTFFAQAAPDDVVLIALMGHGVVTQEVFYFLPYTADLSNLSTDGLPMNEFETAVREVGKKVQRLILAIDTCHAGALEIRVRGMKAQRSEGKQSRGISLAEGLAPRVREAYILSSSTETEESLEDINYRLPGEKKGHGAFTYALLRGLRGEADPNRAGVVNVLDLFTYASAQVPKITGGRQHPHVRGEGTNFPLAETPALAKPEDVKEATVLLQQGREQKKQGQLDQAEQSFARAKELNPSDEVPELLYAEVEEEKAYRNDTKRQRETVEEAKKLIEAARKGSPAEDDPWTPRPMVVTFLGFDTLGGAKENGGLHEVLVQRVGQALQGTKRVHIVDRRLLDKVLEEFKLSASELSDPATRLKVGRVLVARLIATGDIVFVSANHLALNLRMIDTETTEIKFNLSKDGKDPEKILAVADEVALSIAEQLQQEYPIRGKIIDVEGDEVILNIGAKHGLTPGSRMKALVEEPIEVNGEVIAHKKKELGTIEITSVEEKAAFARIIERKGTLEKGTKVIETLTTGPKS